jgi:hypothetical protein
VLYILYIYIRGTRARALLTCERKSWIIETQLFCVLSCFFFETPPFGSCLEKKHVNQKSASVLRSCLPLPAAFLPPPKKKRGGFGALRINLTAQLTNIKYKNDKVYCVVV